MIIKIKELDASNPGLGFRMTYYVSMADTTLGALGDYIERYSSKNVLSVKNEYEGLLSKLQVVSVEVVDAKYVLSEKMTVKDVFDLMPLYWQKYYERFDYSKRVNSGKDQYSISDVMCEWKFELKDETVDGEHENIEDYFCCEVVEVR